MRLKLAKPILLYEFKDVELWDRSTKKVIYGHFDARMTDPNSTPAFIANSIVNLSLPNFSVFDIKCNCQLIVFR